MKVRDINSIVEALREGRVNEILYSTTTQKIREVIVMARKKGVPVYRARIKEKIVADISPIRFASFERILERGLNDGSFILFLDNVEDQRNIGACIRTAEFFGAAGVVIPKRRGGMIEEGALRASAGAIFHIPIARIDNFASALKKLRKYGFTVIAADPDGEDIQMCNFSTPSAIVVGGEDRGISTSVRKQSDIIVKIPGSGKTSSLNLSVAAGILIYELSRQKY
ncbi:23S rRNA (guanosine(2251)-2'-O)-methyltransferase RlmB [Archaeoglobus neptunius]|uniref:23S rRNA (guanosine(2251)-2'-O)-methyltransferase RlmB n=1 Tax=Archaeoglobus neptunius TaxID=2798580 RepID=UPI0019257381|nr:23S rRNA (guanosine(2251)-2'-O)-methyltransferase RlmB [Archaeoglobus neptunius]